MDYSLNCQCGTKLIVPASAAGAEITCSACRRQVSVPRLSVLRQLAGKGAFESGTIDTIHRMIQEGTLPWGTECAHCGRFTQDACDIHVECERTWSKKPSTVEVFFTILFRSVLLWQWFLNQEHETQGRETVIRVPLRVCSECQSKLTASKATQSLAAVPIYARLLTEYHGAKALVD